MNQHNQYPPQYPNRPDPVDRGDFGHPVHERIQYPPMPDFPNVGIPERKPKKPGAAVWIAAGASFIVGVGVGGVFAGGGDASTAATASQPAATVTQTIPGPAVTETTTLPPQPAKTVTQAPPGPSGSIPGDGVFEVGVDFKAGTYKAPNPDGDCYWARLSSTDGSFDSIIANDNPGGPTTVTIRKTDKAFETARCGEWKRVR